MDVLKDMQNIKIYESKLSQDLKEENLDKLKIPFIYQGEQLSQNSEAQPLAQKPGMMQWIKQFLVPDVKNTHATLAALLLNVVIFIFLMSKGLEGGQSLSSFMQVKTDSLLNYGGSQPKLIYDSWQIYRWLTCCFLHANFWHLLFNLIFMAYIMCPMEKCLGKLKLATIYLTSGFFGNLISCVMSSDPSRIIVGASTCLFGVLAYLPGYFLLNFNAFDKPSLKNLRLGLIVITSIIVVLILVVGMGGDSKSTIDSNGHFGGFIIGLSLSLFVPNPVNAGAYETKLKQAGQLCFAATVVVFLFSFFFIKQY